MFWCSGTNKINGSPSPFAHVQESPAGATPSTTPLLPCFLPPAAPDLPGILLQLGRHAQRQPPQVMPSINLFCGSTSLMNSQARPSASQLYPKKHPPLLLVPLCPCNIRKGGLIRELAQQVCVFCRCSFHHRLPKHSIQANSNALDILLLHLCLMCRKLASMMCTTR